MGQWWDGVSLVARAGGGGQVEQRREQSMGNSGATVHGGQPTAFTAAWAVWLFTSEKGLILEEWPAAGCVSKTEWYLNPFMQ